MEGRLQRGSGELQVSLVAIQKSCMPAKPDGRVSDSLMPGDRILI